MSGKLIVIEGLDGSGKSTQLDLLPEKLKKCGREIKTVSFPDYDDPSSTLVKMYLSGEFGSKPNDVNGYAASLFYAVDRFASFKKYWQSFYENGGIVIAGRYVTSNAVHQCSKLPENKWDKFLNWLYDLEYDKVGIPKPDKVIFLDMPPEVSKKLLSHRYSGDESKRDIHEKDYIYLEHCRKAALYAAEHDKWDIVKCADGEVPRSIEDISEEIISKVNKIL